MIPPKLAEKLSIRVPFFKFKRRVDAAICASSGVNDMSCSKVSASNFSQCTTASLLSSVAVVRGTETHSASIDLTSSDSFSTTSAVSLTNSATVSAATFCWFSETTIFFPDCFVDFFFCFSPPCNANIARVRSSSSWSIYFFSTRLSFAFWPRFNVICFCAVIDVVTDDTSSSTSHFFSFSCCDANIFSAASNEPYFLINFLSRTERPRFGCCCCRSGSVAGFASLPLSPSSMFSNSASSIGGSSIISSFSIMSTLLTATSSSSTWISMSVWFCGSSSPISACSSSAVSSIGTLSSAFTAIADNLSSCTILSAVLNSTPSISSSSSIRAKSRRSFLCRNMDSSSPSRNSTPIPISNGEGGKKFFLPRTINDPTVRYSPVGAVFDTWCASTHHAEVMIRLDQALEWHIVKFPASRNACSDNGIISVLWLSLALRRRLARNIQDEAPWTSACKYASPVRKYRFTNNSFCCASRPPITK